MRWAALAALALASPALAATRHQPWLGLALEERFDSAAAVGGGAELMSKISPELGYLARDERLKLELSYDADLIHHLSAGNFTLDHRARAEYHQLLSRRLTLKAGGFFYRVEDTATLPRFGVANLHVPALWGRAELSARYRLSHRLTLEAGYAGEVTRLFLEGLPYGVTHTGQLRLSWDQTPRVQWGLLYRAQLFAAGLIPDSQGQSLAATGRFVPWRHSFVALEAGPLLYAARGGAFVTPRWRAELGYEARGAELGLVAGRDLVGAAGYAIVVWADFLQAAGALRLSRSLQLLAAGGAFRNGLAPDQALTAQGYALSAGLEWRLSRTLTAHLGYDRIAQVGTDALDFGLSRNIVSARIFWRTP